MPRPPVYARSPRRLHCYRRRGGGRDRLPLHTAAAPRRRRLIWRLGARGLGPDQLRALASHPGALALARDLLEGGQS